MRAGEEGVRGRTGLLHYYQYILEDLSLAPYDREQFLEVEHQPEDRYDLGNGVLLSPAGEAEYDDPTRLIGAFCALVNQIGIGSGRVQAPVMPGAKLRLTNETAKGAAEHMVVRSSARWGSSFLLASERGV